VEPQRIARSDELARLIKSRIGKSGVNVQNRRHSQLEGRFELAPEQEPIRRIERKPASRIWLNHGISVIAEELIEIVEITECLRANIGRI
jgi:ribulose-5-phosphate 4-epimerase/fuculose-1-phosphate aldolase